MIGKPDLHEKFIEVLKNRLPKKDRVSVIADILKLEKDAVYRRMNGKVNFSVRETGIIANALDISLDQLKPRANEFLWIPFLLGLSEKSNSIDTLLEYIDSCLEAMDQLDPLDSEAGNIYSSLPMEYYLYSPVLRKFMFFKWGYYFIGSREFYNYTDWYLPARADSLFQRLAESYHFNRVYYVWDISLVSSLGREIRNFYKMRIITPEQKDELKDELKNLLTDVELSLSGTHIPYLEFMSDIDFYVSSMHVGFTINYFSSDKLQKFIIHSPFSYCRVQDDEESFVKLKNWADSFKNLSTLLSKSGRVERRLFFEEQHATIDFLLD